MNKPKHTKHTRHSTALNKADGTGATDAVDAGFFLPDLCEKEAVLFLVIVS